MSQREDCRPNGASRYRRKSAEVGSTEADSGLVQLQAVIGASANTESKRWRHGPERRRPRDEIASCIMRVRSGLGSKLLNLFRRPTPESELLVAGIMRF